MAVGFVAEVGKLRGKDEGLLGEGKEDGGMGKEDGVEQQVDGLIPRWMLKNWLPKQSRQAVEGHIIGDDGGPPGQQEHKMGDVGGRGGSKRRILWRDMVYSRRERKEHRP